MAVTTSREEAGEVADLDLCGGVGADAGERLDVVAGRRVELGDALGVDRIAVDQFEGAG